MNTVELIDAVFRQTTVLIAELSTASGGRAPLAHVADQVFRDLSREIEGQGVRQKVVADMFGMALRSYQKKVRRLRESETHKNKTLWEVVYRYIEKNAPVTRGQVMQRMRYDAESDVAAVLLDLHQSGLIHSSGRGDTTVYGVSDSQPLGDADHQTRLDGVCDALWLYIAREGPIAREVLAEQLPYEPSLLDEALQVLQDQGSVELTTKEDDALYHSSRFLMPAGHERGWEAAVFDHFQTVTRAIASKLRQGQRRSRLNDHTGGGTLSFDLCAGHPMEQEVYSIMRDLRRRVSDVWDRLEEYNEAHPLDQASRRRVLFYYGQALEAAEQDDPR